MNGFHVFDLTSALFDTPTPQPDVYLEVRLQFNSNQEIETVNFQSLNVFNFVADSVTVLRWKHISELDGEKDLLSDGTSLDSMNNYFSELEANARKAEKAAKNKR
jgi:hypothetical protein